MPYVNVIFDPQKISQPLISSLKVELQTMVAGVLSSIEVFEDGYSGYDIRDTRTVPEKIMVLQHATHPSDVNVPPFEIYIEAGRQKGRSERKIVKLLGQMISELELIPNEYLGEDQSGIFVTFHDKNGFGFIPRHS